MLFKEILQVKQLINHTFSLLATTTHKEDDKKYVIYSKRLNARAKKYLQIHEYNLHAENQEHEDVQDQQLEKHQ